MAQRILDPVRSKPSLKRPYPASVCPSQVGVSRGARRGCAARGGLGPRRLSAIPRGSGGLTACGARAFVDADALGGASGKFGRTRHAAHSMPRLGRERRSGGKRSSSYARRSPPKRFPCGRQRQYCDDPPGQLPRGSRFRRRRYWRRGTTPSTYSVAPLVMAALQVHWLHWPPSSSPAGSRRSTFPACVAMRFSAVAAWYARSRRIRVIATCIARCAPPNGTWCGVLCLNAAPRARNIAYHSLEANAATRARSKRAELPCVRNLRAMPRVRKIL